MGCGSYIFLNRNYEYDQRVLETMIKYYKDSHGTYQLLLFPEGTDRGERAVSISHTFADRNGLPRYDYLLHPRVTGFNYILNQMRKHNYIEYVYDVTVGYPRTIVESEIKLVKTGKFPDEVHFDVKRYKLEEVLGGRVDGTEEVDASRWLTDLWKSKEERLKEFYSRPPEERQFDPSGERYVWPVETGGLGYYVAFSFWILITSLWTYLLVYSLGVKIYAAVVIAFYLWAQRHSGGVCFLLLEWFYGHRFFFEKGR
ncbi:CRE-ACL-8 protein [Aphelenchoides avenae]|nr:CRE-ACL-8 protein [Aphelenchus avenae]